MPESDATIFDEIEYTRTTGNIAFVDWLQLVQRELKAHGYREQDAIDLVELFEASYVEDYTPHRAIGDLIAAGTILKT